MDGQTYPILEELARELETFHDRHELTPIISHARDDNYDRNELLAELDEFNLGFFAAKLSRGYYEEYRDAFLDSIAATEAPAPQEAPVDVESAVENPPVEEPVQETPEVTEATPEQSTDEPAPQPEEPQPSAEPEVPSEEDADKRRRLEELYALGDLPPVLMDERDTLERELGVKSE